MDFDEIFKEPIPRTTLVSEILERFLGLIISGELPPGQKLPPERELADKLGVGRSSLREALRALSMIGAIEARPGPSGGTFVTESSARFFLTPFILREHVTEKNIWELMEVRLTIEEKSAALAAERGRKKDKDLIRQCFDRCVSTKDEFERYVEEDWHFHEAIAQAAHNSYLLQTLLMIGYLVRDCMSQSVDSNSISNSIQGHQELLDAIQARKADAARIAMQKHLEIAAGTFRFNKAKGQREYITRRIDK